MSVWSVEETFLDAPASPLRPVCECALEPQAPLGRQVLRPLRRPAGPDPVDLLEDCELRAVELLLALQVVGRLLRLEEPEERDAQHGFVAIRPLGLGVEEPLPQRRLAGRGDRVRLAVARAARGLADQPVLAEPRELRVDLAVLGRPDVA